MIASLQAGPRRIVLCVDDVGLSDAVDGAVLALHDMGRASAASLLVDGPSLERSAASLRARATSGLELGLHLNLTESWPATAAARVPRSTRPLTWLATMAYSGLIDRARLRGELRRQLDAFVRIVGRVPDFIDGHQHVQQLPIVRDELLDELLERDWLPLPWIRCGKAPPWPPHSPLPLSAQIKAVVITRMGAAALQRGLDRCGMRSNARLLGVRRLDTDAACYERALRGWIAVAEDADLLMVHAARGEGTSDGLHLARAMEFDVLRSPVFANLMRERQATIAPLRAIAPVQGVSGPSPAPPAAPAPAPESGPG